MRTGFRLRSRTDWLYRRATAGRRMLPHFIIIGAQKAGTTSLYSYLCGHPGIEPALEKEVHFFDNEYSKGMGWYRAHFPLRRPGIVTGEATPYYLFHPLTPRRVAETLPGVKLIALLRNPVDRAYSHYHHSLRGGVETLSFEDALAREPQRLGGEPGRMLGDSAYRSPSHQHYSYLSRGVYVDQLAAWYETFPREQVLVLTAEDLYSRPAEAVREAVELLGLPRLEMGQVRTWNGARNPPMDPQTRRRLVEFFRPHNQRLYEYLGIDPCWEE